MLIVNQGWKTVSNLSRYDGLGVRGSSIVLIRDGKEYVIGRYKDDERAERIFEDLLEDFSEAGSLPFEESANPYWIPAE